MTSELKEQVKKVIVAHLDVTPDVIHDHTSFTEVLGFDSLDAADLLIAIDEAFGIRVPIDKMKAVDTLDGLVAAIAEEQAKK